jgi:hypothetical protein
MIAAERFNGFRAETNLDIISEIKEAQQEDESLLTCREPTSLNAWLLFYFSSNLSVTRGSPSRWLPFASLVT